MSLKSDKTAEGELCLYLHNKALTLSCVVNQTHPNRPLLGQDQAKVIRLWPDCDQVVIRRPSSWKDHCMIFVR